MSHLTSLSRLFLSVHDSANQRKWRGNWPLRHQTAVVCSSSNSVQNSRFSQEMTRYFHQTWLGTTHLVILLRCGKKLELTRWKLRTFVWIIQTRASAVSSPALFITASFITINSSSRKNHLFSFLNFIVAFYTSFTLYRSVLRFNKDTFALWSQVLFLRMTQVVGFL